MPHTLLLMLLSQLLQQLPSSLPALRMSHSGGNVGTWSVLRKGERGPALGDATFNTGELALGTCNIALRTGDLALRTGDLALSTGVSLLPRPAPSGGGDWDVERGRRRLFANIEMVCMLPPTGRLSGGILSTGAAGAEKDDHVGRPSSDP